MGFTIIDFINLIALFIGIIGSYLMFYFSPVVNSQTYLYQKSELAEIKKRDMRKNKMVRRGMFLLFIGFILQAIAIFLNIATK
jgi:hypothetical protein